MHFVAGFRLQKYLKVLELMNISSTAVLNQLGIS